MKAVILAGGQGTRGKPYTDYFPKAMIPINGRPLIDYVVRYLESFDSIDELVIISDFEGLGGQIKNYYSYSKDIVFLQDSQDGTGGDLVHLEGTLGDESEFVLWFVDNLCAVNIAEMTDTFKEKGSLACIATRTKRREETGFATVRDGIVTEFKEKPTVPLPQFSECLGVYVISTDIISQIKALQTKHQKSVNLSYDILQQLAQRGRVSAYDIQNKGWIDAQSPVTIERNRELVARIIQEMGLQ